MQSMLIMMEQLIFMNF